MFRFPNKKSNTIDIGILRQIGYFKLKKYVLLQQPLKFKKQVRIKIKL